MSGSAMGTMTEQHAAAQVPATKSWVWVKCCRCGVSAHPGYGWQFGETEPGTVVEIQCEAPGCRCPHARIVAHPKYTTTQPSADPNS